MVITEDGIVIEVREWQLRKPSLPIDVMLVGRVIEVRERQPEKTPASMDNILSSDKSAWPLFEVELIEAREAQVEKAWAPMEVTEEGIVIEARYVQP